MDYNVMIHSSDVVMLEFYASWCPHCRKMEPVVEQVRKAVNGHVPIWQIDIDKETALSDDLNIQTVPTFIIYRHGGEVWRHSGEIDGNLLLSKLQTAM